MSIMFLFLMMLFILHAILTIGFAAEKRVNQLCPETMKAQEKGQSDDGSFKALAKEWGPIVTPFGTLLSAMAALLASGLALYVGILREKVRKPQLKLYFLENKQYPYFFSLSFGSLGHTVLLSTGDKIELLRPGFSGRIKVKNVGKTIAKEVQARIEKIEFIAPQKPTTFYHPTAVKWSGEEVIGTVDIVSGSHFFLDIFFAINTTVQEMTKFNYEEMKNKNINMGEERVKRIFTEETQIPEEVYWNVWVKDPYFRGIPTQFNYEGSFVISYIINGENFNPVKFKAIIDWNIDNWSSPDIRIKDKKEYINREEDHKNE